MTGQTRSNSSTWLDLLESEMEVVRACLHWYNELTDDMKDEVLQSYRNANAKDTVTPTKRKGEK